MRIRIFNLLFAFSTLLLSGCIDYGVESRRLSLTEIPDKVLAAFVRANPDCAIESVEIYTRRISIVGYRVHYRRSDGSFELKNFSQKGEEIVERATNILPSQVGSDGNAKTRVE